MESKRARLERDGGFHSTLPHGHPVSVDHPNSSLQTRTPPCHPAWHWRGCQGPRGEGRLSEATDGMWRFPGNAHPPAEAPLSHLRRDSQPVLGGSRSPPYIKPPSQFLGLCSLSSHLSSLLPTTLLLKSLCFPLPGATTALPAHLPQVQLPPEHPGWAASAERQTVGGVHHLLSQSHQVWPSSSVKGAASRNNHAVVFTLHPANSQSANSALCCLGSLGAVRSFLICKGLWGGGVKKVNMYSSDFVLKFWF